MSDRAVVIIDVQNAILDEPGLIREDETQAALDAVIGRIASILGRARKAGMPVLFVQHDGGRGDRLERGTAGWEIRQEIAPLTGEPVIHKKACDSFFETTLDAELRSRGIDHLIVAGCMTQFCVDTTVRRAVSLGYDVTLVADGHMTVDSGGLTFEQIIAHHNAVLYGIDAGPRRVQVVESRLVEADPVLSLEGR